MKSILTLLLVGIMSTAFAERISGPANIRGSVPGEVMFSLLDNVEVESLEPLNGWFKVAVSVRLSKAQYEQDPLILKKGTKLYSYHGGKLIGTIVNDLTIYNKSEGANDYIAMLIGFTHRNNIRTESIVEPVLSKLIESNRGRLTLDVFADHMNYFGYFDGLDVKDMEELKTYMVYESWLEDPSPLDRIRLIFDQDELVGVVYSRNLSISGYETVEIERARKLVLIKTFKEDEKKLFIAKNKETYWGID